MADQDTKHADVLAELREFLRQRIDAEAENRANALADLKFLAGDQWPEQTKRLRTAEQRPALTINKLPAFLHQITNDLRQNRQSVKVHPVDDGADVQTAGVIQGLIRHIEYASDADVCYDTSSGHAAAIGFGYFRLLTDYCAPDSFDQEIKFARIRNPFAVYCGPHEAADGSDMTQCAITSMVPSNLFKRQHPDVDASPELDRGLGEDHALWYDKGSVRVAEYYRIEYEEATLVALSNGETGWKDQLIAENLPPGITISRERKSNRQKVRWYKCTAADVLDEADIPCEWIPVFPVYGDELDIEGKVIRSGLIRHAKDPAQMYNFWMHQSLDTPVATPLGWSTIGALQIGDQVFSDTGEVANVIGKSPVYIGKDCYRVTFGDGSQVVSSAEHPWVVQERGKRTSGGFNWVERKLRTDELNPAHHCIKVAGPLTMPQADLPIDPYVLGVWLGDGSRGSGTVSAGHDDIDAMRAQLLARGARVGNSRSLDTASPCFTVHGIVDALRGLGVLNDKHIPLAYLRASADQRLELLRGLMDTDGTVHKVTGSCMFTQASEAFAEQVRELIVSLGMRVGVTRRAGRVSMLANGQAIESTGCTQLAFTPPAGMAVFSLPRKAQIQKRHRPRHARRAQHKIISVERVDSVPVQCIGIDAPSHLYLCGWSMIPTHNTSATEEVAMRPRIPYIMAEGQEEGHEAEWQQANVRSFPYLTYKPVTLAGQFAPPPQRTPMTDVPQGVLALAMHANDNIKAVTGLFDASLGAKGNETSGRAILARQRQGDVSNFHFADNLTRAIRHAGRCILSMIPKVYDTPRVVRILGEDETVSHAQVNQPLQQPEVDEKTGAIKRVLNDLTVGKYDVTVSTGPSYSTMRQEAAEAMTQFGQAWPKLMDVAGDKVVKAMDWPGAEEIAERIARTIPPEIRTGENDTPEAPMVPTPHGPMPIEQAGQALAQLMQQVQEMGQALQEAKSGVDRERIKADSAIEVARINAEARQDAEELKGVIQMLIQHMQPPPVLTADVAKDITEGDQPAQEGQPS